jgi:hypothetical protein
MTDREDGCAGHSGLAAELRALAITGLDRLEPLLERVRDEPATAATGPTCSACPICAVIAALRGERPELAVRLAEQAGGILAVLRAALEEGDPAPRPADDPTPPPSGRTVQRIPVERVGARL